MFTLNVLQVNKIMQVNSTISRQLQEYGVGISSTEATSDLCATTKVQGNIDISRTLDLLSKKKIKAIIEDKKLFWDLFCYIYSTEELNKDFADFNISVNKKTKKGTVIARIHIIPGVQKVVERVRQLAVKGFSEKKDPHLSVIRSKILNCYIVEHGSSYDVSEDRLKLVDFYYENYVRQHMSSLFKSLGATCKITKEKQMVTVEHGQAYEHQIDVVKVHWDRTACDVYPITPQPISARGNIAHGLYAQYKEQQCCDITVNSIPAHSCLLYLFGGKVIQAMLTTSMKENLTKTITFNGVSEDTIRAFLDYIYLETEAFSEQLISSSKIDGIFKLFKFAHCYQVSQLVDCCTNIISLIACSKDRETIKSFAEKYNNQHLEKLHAYLLGMIVPDL